MMSHLLALHGVICVLAVAPERNQHAAAVRHLRLMLLVSLAVPLISCRAGQILLQPEPILRGEVLLMTSVLGHRLVCKQSSLQIREGTTASLDLAVHSV
jgi:hypothetical protein